MKIKVHNTSAKKNGSRPASNSMLALIVGQPPRTLQTLGK